LSIAPIHPGGYGAHLSPQGKSHMATQKTKVKTARLPRIECFDDGMYNVVLPPPPGSRFEGHLPALTRQSARDIIARWRMMTELGRGVSWPEFYAATGRAGKRTANR
ncbi:MAG TPA: hypothetical protein VGF90_05575, partial [Verrucomicrobiae bacterium]